MGKMKHGVAVMLIMSCVLAFGAKCPDCNGTGKVDVECRVCEGKGYIKGSTTRQWKKGGGETVTPVACKACLKGMARPGMMGSGKVKEACPTCKGSGQVKNIGGSSQQASNGNQGLKEIKMTKNQWKKVIQAIDLNGSVEMTKSGIKIVVVDDEAETMKQLSL